MVHHWCNVNKMSLNLDKCFCITFHRIKEPIIFNYTIGTLSLTRVYSIKNLCIHFTASLIWDIHVQSICSKPLTVLSLIFRMSRSLTSLHALRTLYYCWLDHTLNIAVWFGPPIKRTSQRQSRECRNCFQRLLGVQLGYRYLHVLKDDVSLLLVMISDVFR